MLHSLFPRTVLCLVFALALSLCGCSDDDPKSPDTPTGACCQEAVCDVQSVAHCDERGGVYQGDDTGCDPIPCVVGACCVDGVCSVVSWVTCGIRGGNYWGDEVSCSPAAVGERSSDDSRHSNFGGYPDDGGHVRSPRRGLNEDGVLVVHYAAGVVPTRAPDFCDNLPVQSCADVVSDYPDPDGDMTVAVVIAVFPEWVNPTVSGLSFGITYDTGVADFGSCGVFELNTPEWPEPGSGTSLVFDPPEQRNAFAVAWFALYAYDGSAFEIADHPTQGTASFEDDSVPAVLDEVEGYGALGFGSRRGRRPCVPCQ